MPRGRPFLQRDNVGTIRAAERVELVQAFAVHAGGFLQLLHSQHQVRRSYTGKPWQPMQNTLFIRLESSGLPSSRGFPSRFGCRPGVFAEDSSEEAESSSCEKTVEGFPRGLEPIQPLCENRLAVVTWLQRAGICGLAISCRLWAALSPWTAFFKDRCSWLCTDR